MILIKSSSHNNFQLKTQDSQRRAFKQERVSFSSLLNDNMRFSESYRPNRQQKFMGQIKKCPKRKLFPQNNPNLLNVQKRSEKWRQMENNLINSHKNVQKLPKNNLFTDLIKHRSQSSQAKNQKKLNSCLYSRQTADSQYWNKQVSNNQKKSQKRPTSHYFNQVSVIREKSRPKDIQKSQYFSFPYSQPIKNFDDSLEEADCVNTSQASIQFDMNPYL